MRICRYLWFKKANAAKHRGVCVACLPAAYEVSCRVRTGRPSGFWPDSPRTVASRRYVGSPAPRRRGLGGKAATNWRRNECTRVPRHVNANQRPPRGAELLVDRGDETAGKPYERARCKRRRPRYLQTPTTLPPSRDDACRPPSTVPSLHSPSTHPPVSPRRNGLATALAVRQPSSAGPDRSPSDRSSWNDLPT
jgi:hypothetical protein